MSDQHPRIIQAQIEALQAQMRELRAEPPLVELGGSGPHDPGMEARIAKLEADVGHIQSDVAEIKGDIKELRRVFESDFRLLFGAIIAAVLSLAGVMAKEFHWI